MTAAPESPESALAAVLARNPYLPAARDDGQHLFPNGSYRCSRCGVYNRTDSPPFHEPCEGAWAQSGKFRYAAEDRWKSEVQAAILAATPTAARIEAD